MDYSVYTMRQASRRSWRIGQTQPVQVVFMAYRNTLQAEALKLVAKKLQSSLAVEGELPEDGLAAYGDDGDDLMLALVRKIVSGEEDADSVESVFAQAQQVAADAEALLVDGDWRAPEPVMSTSCLVSWQSLWASLSGVGEEATGVTVVAGALAGEAGAGVPAGEGVVAPVVGGGVATGGGVSVAVGAADSPGLAGAGWAQASENARSIASGSKVKREPTRRVPWRAGACVA